MLLIGLSLLGQCSKYLFGHPMLKGFVEMLGVVILIRALLEYIEEHLGGLQISFANHPPRPATN